MTAGNHNFTIEKGATFNPVVTWKGSNGTAIDITGYSARMHIRKTKNDPNTIFALTSANGKLTLGDDAGTIEMLLTATETAAVTDASGVYDLELESAAGVVTRLLEGAVVFSNEVTR